MMETIKIPAIQVSKMKVKIVGETPLLSHKFTEKAKASIEKTQQGESEKKKKRNPDQEFQDAAYVDAKGNDCAPGSWLFQSMYSAAGFNSKSDKEGFKEKERFRMAVRIPFTLYPIEYDKKEMRTDYVKIGGMTKVADMRYRPEYTGWSITFDLEYEPDVISPKRIAEILQRAGKSCGIGDWRVQKKGDFGRFRVDFMQIESNGKGHKK